jgi:uncharacterized membrane protein YedE/YeeE
MIKQLGIFASGLIFGLGLILSGMTNPSKVIHFLDLTGAWDPSLALVMGGAIPVAFVGMRWLERRKQTVLSEPLHLPGTRHITRELVLGSFIFGAGWALAGFCPGPAIAALGMGLPQPVVFVAAMMAGMWFHDTFLQSRHNG